MSQNSAAAATHAGAVVGAAPRVALFRNDGLQGAAVAFVAVTLVQPADLQAVAGVANYRLAQEVLFYVCSFCGDEGPVKARSGDLI